MGRAIRLNEASFTVVGVLRADFRPLEISDTDEPREMFAPLGYDLSQPSACRGCQHLHLLARLKHGVAPGEANAELNTIMRDIVREHPSSYNRDAKVSVAPLRDPA